MKNLEDFKSLMQLASMKRFKLKNVELTEMRNRERKTTVKQIKKF